MFCTRCGHPNRDDARFCVDCGHPLHEDVTVTLPAIEVDDEGHDEFPFPHDELSPGQSLLLVKRGPNAGSTFLIDAEATPAGRDPGSAVFLDDVTVSRRHAVLVDEGGRFSIEDQGSLNGTFVNRKRVESAQLEDGDELQIGKYRLTFLNR